MCYVPEAPASGKATAHVAMATDPLSISQELRAAGFTEEQANLLATHMASRSDDLVTKEDLALAMSHLETRLLLKLGAAMVGGLGLILAAMSISVAVMLNQLG